MKKIKIELNNLDNATNQFNNEVLDNELDNYITNTSLHILPKEQLIKLIHTHYEKKVKQLKQIDKYDDYFRMILLLLGIILIIISEHLTSFLSELFLIAGWVVVWEMVYDILFTGMKRKRSLNLYKKLATCKIEFLN